MTIDDDKSQAHKQAFAARKAVHGTGRDAAAQEALRSLLAPWHDAALAGYMPIRTEIDPRPAMAAQAGSCSGASMTVANWPRGQIAKVKANEEASRTSPASTLTERRYKAVHSQNVAARL